LQPYSVSLWIRTSCEQQEQFGSADVTSIADDDPLLAYVLSHSSTLEIDRLQLDSAVLQVLMLHFYMLP